MLAYGDILFRRTVLEELIEAEGDIVLVVDAHFRERSEVAPGRARDLVDCSHPFTGLYLADDQAVVREIGADLDPERVHGEWIGLARLSARGAERVRDAIEAMRGDGGLAAAGLPELLGRLVAAGETVNVLYIAGQWLDVNDATDLASARNFL